MPCRRNHTNARRYEHLCKRKSIDEDDTSSNLRSGDKQFSFHSDCYICGAYVDQDKARRYPYNTNYEYSHVMVLNVKDTITKRCAERSEIAQPDKHDKWSKAVSTRLACVNDLPSEEAIYHRKCYSYFMSPRNLDLEDLPSYDGVPPKKRGRPTGTVDEVKNSAFLHVVEYLENNDDETITLDELHDIMANHVGTDEVYSKKMLQNQLYAHYGDRVSVTSSKQQPLVVTLSSNVKQLI